MEIILLLHLFATLFMTGLCWFVQIAHYPLFYEIRRDLSSYENKNVLLTAYVTLPVMLIELVSGIYLLYLFQNLLHWTNMLLFGITVLSTLLFQAPTHLQLMGGSGSALIKKLIRTNWIRTLSWTIRSIILLMIVYDHLIHYC